jgi:hypothetical protein
MKKWSVIVMAGLSLFISLQCAAADKLPAFIMVGNYQNTALSLLVPVETTKEGLKALIFEFRKARQEGRLPQMIPTTTKGGALGDYAVMDIYVFTQAAWASQTRLQRFIRMSLKRPDDIRFSEEYSGHIKAYYFYSAITKEEQGSIGYDGGGRMRSRQYEKIF